MKKQNTKKQIRTALYSLGFLVSAFIFSPAQGGLLPNIEKQGWEEIRFDGKQPNSYETCGEDCIRIETNSSVSMIGKPVAIDLTKTPIVTWEWKIEKPAPVSDLSVKGRDDRAIALYVTFPYDSETATFSEKLLRPFIEMMRGEDAPGRMLSYVWGSSGEPGDTFRGPYFGDISTIIICRTQEDPVGKWIMERLDVAADYKRAFGTAPKMASHVLLGADSDDVGIDSLAFVRNISFEAAKSKPLLVTGPNTN